VQLAAARAYVESETLGNLEFRQGDLFSIDLPGGSFDLVHARFVLAPIGRAGEVLDRMMQLVNAGGLIVLEEPDPVTWDCVPPVPAWDELKEAVFRTFQSSGSDFSSGTRLGTLLLRRGLHSVHVRECALTLAGGHPYCRLLIQMARALKPRILSYGLLTEGDFENAISVCDDLPRALTLTRRRFGSCKPGEMLNTSLSSLRRNLVPRR